MRISQVRIPVASRQWQSFIANPYVQHSELAACFDNDGRLLYRVEPETTDGMVTLLIQSNRTPDWCASERFASLAPHLLSSKEFQLGLREGQRLRFRLRANPTVKRDGRRHAVAGDEDLTAWLERKFGAIGAVLGGVVSIPEGTIRAQRLKGPNGRTMTFASVRFEGHLNVCDPVALKAGVSAGVGSGKAFGFGLLSLARA